MTNSLDNWCHWPT